MTNQIVDAFAQTAESIVNQTTQHVPVAPVAPQGFQQPAPIFQPEPMNSPQQQPVAPQGFGEPQQQPVMQQPVQEQSQIPEPVMQQPTIEADPIVINDNMLNQIMGGPEPIQTQPVQQPIPEPVLQQSVIQEPVLQQPVLQEPIAEPVLTQQPVQTQPVQQPTPEQGPLDSITESFSPNVEDKQIIAAITPADYDNMVKILQILNKENNDESITIKQSQIKQGQTDCVIEANIQEVLKNKNGEFVDLDIINPKKYIKLLEQFKSQDDIFIIQDNENSRYIVTNGEVRLFLPKQDDTNVQQDAQTFDMSGCETICQFEVDKDIRKIVKNLAKDQDYIDYLFQDGKVKAIHIPDTAIYTFPEYKGDLTAQALDETNTELALRSSNFLPVDADIYNVYIIKLTSGKYASVSDCKSGKIAIRTTEICDLATGGNLLF